MMKNEYLPYKSTIMSIQEEDYDTKTYRIVIDNVIIRDSFTFKQGQFMELSILGVGEAPFSIVSTCPSDLLIHLNTALVSACPFGPSPSWYVSTRF